MIKFIEQFKNIKIVKLLYIVNNNKIENSE